MSFSTALTCAFGSRCAISRHSAARSLHSLELIIGYSPNRTHQHTTSDMRCVMAKKPTESRRKLVEFDAQTWHALNLLSRESRKTFQELADEAFRDLLHKYARPPI